MLLRARSRRSHSRLLACWALLALAGTPAAGQAATRQVFLWYPDGGPPPASVRKICQGTPPAFQCRSGADLDECRRNTQALLDRWYADFDVTFSYAAPTGGTFDTVVVASEGSWCGADARTASRSPLPDCVDAPGGAVAIFHCGDDAKRCATLIAKEQAHLVGLQHTGGLMDVMSDQTSLEHDGFEDAENLSSAVRCGRFQNSYRLMLQRLGAWAGGPKPEPTLPPSPLPEPAPADAAPGVEPDAASPAPPDAGAPAPVPADKGGGGCAFAVGPHPGDGGGWWRLALVGLIGAAARRRKGTERGLL